MSLELFLRHSFMFLIYNAPAKIELDNSLEPPFLLGITSFHIT